MKFLIAGLGSIGRRHLKNLVALGEDDIILYRTRKSTLPDAELAEFETFTDLQTALDQNPQAVIIANPTAFHMYIAVPAVRRGCAIFLEKPPSHRLADLVPFEQALSASKSQVFCGFQFRFNPGLRFIQSALESDTIGRVLSFSAAWGEYLPDWHPWEDYKRSYAARSDIGGGVVLTLCHPLDYLRWLFGEVRAVSAMLSSNSGLGIDVEDCADSIMRFENHVQGNLHLDYFRKPKRHGIEIVGTRGILYWENRTSAVQLSMEGKQFRPAYQPPDDYERNSMYMEEMRHFIAVTKGTEEPLVPYVDCRKTMQLALAIKQASMEKKWIELPNSGAK